MKYTLFITQDCNLACEYCYIGKRPARMSLDVARNVADFMFAHTPKEEKVNVGFFGGEPLLEFDLVRSITELIEEHPAYGDYEVEFMVVTNGTIFSDAIAEFVRAHDMGFGISCDGPAFVQDRFRRRPGGGGTSATVVRTIRAALEAFELVPVNAVYRPETLRHLPGSVEYLASLGVRQIYLNPDYTASWTKQDVHVLQEAYRRVAEQYKRYYLEGNPRYLSLIDNKIAVLLRGGYAPLERCRMGKGEFAFTPEGKVYPCERLVGAGDNGHALGDIMNGDGPIEITCRAPAHAAVNPECAQCGLRQYCMNWCGCSNYFSSGAYDRVGAFLCASEKAAIETALEVFKTLEDELGPTFIEHAGGQPRTNSILR